MKEQRILNMKNMKKYWITACFILSLGWMTQVAAQGGVDFGAKAGVNIANVWDAEGQDFAADAKLGFAGGVFLGIPIGSVLGFQPEILISQKGFRGTGTLNGEAYILSRTQNYVDVPLFLQIRPVPMVTLLLGPQYSYLFRTKNKFTAGSNSVVIEEEFANENIRRNTFGLVFGGDFEASFLVISPRLGFDMYRNNGDGTSTTPRYKNRWLQLAVGVKI
jgi:hypothetical protein